MTALDLIKCLKQPKVIKIAPFVYTSSELPICLNTMVTIIFRRFGQHHNSGRKVWNKWNYVVWESRNQYTLCPKSLKKSFKKIELKAGVCIVHFDFGDIFSPVNRREAKDSLVKKSQKRTTFHSLFCSHSLPFFPLKILFLLLAASGHIFAPDMPPIKATKYTIWAWIANKMCITQR